MPVLRGAEARGRDELQRRVAELERVAAERDRLAEALKASEERFRAALAGLDEVVYSTAADGSVVHFIGEACESLYGRPARAFFANPGLWEEVIHPEDRPRVRAAAARALEGAPFAEDYRIQLPDGRLRWVRDRATLVRDEAGEPQRLNGIVRDVTDQTLVRDAAARSQERMDLALEAARAGAWEWDSKTGETHWSAQNFELLGYAPGAVEASYANWLAAVHPDDRAQASAAVQRAMDDRADLDIRFRVRWPDGSARWIHDVGRMICDADGRPRGFYGIQIDVTERMSAERSLAEMRDLLQTMMDSTPDWLFAKDLEHRFLFVNRSFAAAQGLTPEAMIGRSDEEFWGPEQCEPDPAAGHRGFHADDRRAFAGETVRNPDDQARVADGSTRRFDTVKSPLRAPDGRVLGVVGYSRDVTERIETDRALRESEERFRTLVGNIPGSVYRCEIRPPYRDLFLSDGIRAITGYDASEYLAPDGLKCGDLIVPEDRPAVDAAVNEAIASRSAFQVLYRIRHRDGSLRWVGDRGRATYSADGTPLYIDGVHIDVTAQVQAEEALREREERLRAIVENEPECVKLIGRNRELLEMNAAGLRMIEASGLDEVRGKDVREFVADGDRGAFREMHEAVFRGESRTLVFEIVGLNGGHRTLETHAVPMWEGPEHREVRALLGVARDISERLQAERDRQTLEARLRQSQKLEAIGTLAGGIAHDFNNILAAILGRAELLARDVPERSKDAVASIITASERAKDLVTQILTFSRQRDEERRLVALAPVILEALRLLRATLPATIEVRTEIAADAPSVLANESQLHQVMVNLCTNAAHAMREGGGVLTVRLTGVDVDGAFARTCPGLKEGPHVRLTVGDTGHGMDLATAERIFEPFFTTKAPGEGTGLGLAVVHGIMRSHDGLVAVHSVPDRGTTFDLYFPAVANAHPVEPSGAARVPRGSGEHVLVVDDEPVLGDIIREFLTGLGYRVTCHLRPGEAWEDLRRDPRRFDLVVCDLTMPGMTGLDLADRIRELRPELPVVLMTGYGGALDAGVLPQSGIREVIVKPFRVSALGEAVHRHLASTR